MSAEFLGDIDRCIHRDADVGHLKRRAVVDAVAQKSDHVSFSVQGSNDPLLLRRREFCEYGRAIGHIGKFIFAHLFDLTAKNNLAGLKLHFPTNLARDDFIVASQDFHGHAPLGQGGNRWPRALFGWVEKGDVSKQRQVTFVCYGVGRLRGAQFLVGDGHDPESILS